MSRSLVPAFAFIAALTLAVTPALACERHNDHTASVTATAVPLPAPVPSETATKTEVLISPAAAAAMAVTEALGAESYDMRCRRLRKLEQALTQ